MNTGIPGVAPRLFLYFRLPSKKAPSRTHYYMELSETKIDNTRLPRHIAIIMDGNGRWAKERGQDRIAGHYEGVRSVRVIVDASAEIGVEYLTLYAFSTENWKRPADEVAALMELLVATIRKEAEDLKKNGVRLHVIGDIASLPAMCRAELDEAMAMTAENTRLHLILALSYSARWEIADAAKRIATDVAAGVVATKDVDDILFATYLATASFPDPEFMIRTSGERRISNFLLWQLAYAELYFTNVHWPAFRKPQLLEAIYNYQQRERRFGLISEQVAADGRLTTTTNEPLPHV